LIIKGISSRFILLRLNISAQREPLLTLDDERLETFQLDL